MYQGTPVAMRRPWFVALPDYRHPARNILWLSAHWRASDGTDVLLLSTDTASDLQRRDGFQFIGGCWLVNNMSSWGEEINLIWLLTEEGETRLWGHNIYNNDTWRIPFVTSVLGNWDNIGSIPTRLRPGRFGVPIYIGAREFSLLQNVQPGSGAHPASYSVGTRIPSRG